MLLPKTLVIGFGYKARHGKDTAVKSIIESFGSQYDIKRYAFGDALKREVNELDQFAWCMRNGIPYDFQPSMDDPLCRTQHGKQGALLQWYGTEYRRNQDEFYWVNKLRETLEKEQPKVALISDVRFRNEAYFVKACDGFLVKCSRLGYSSIDSGRSTTHKSEVDLDGFTFDYEINVPDGELDTLKQDAVEVFNLILSRVQPEVPDLNEQPASI
jgi:hypothetical protein